MCLLLVGKTMTTRQQTMKAAVYERYGPPEVLKIKDIEKPIPGDREVLIRIHATTVTAECPKQRGLTFPLLLRIPFGLMFGFTKPRKQILGFEFAGEIEAIGSRVEHFKPGDNVYGYTGLSFGAYAEYKCMPENGLVARMPSNLDYEEAAAITNGALTALVFLKKKGRIQRGENVLIYGASGAVGTASVQLAKYFGATVTGVCSTRNVELVRSLGADHVVDYTKEDFTQLGETYDVIFDTVGKTSLTRCKNLLNKGGRYLLTEFGPSAIVQMLWTSVAGSKRVIGAASNMSWETKDLHFLNELIEGARFKPVIDRCYPLEHIREAHRYVEQGRKTGNVVITI